jgi:hypothetical protein
VRWAGYVARVNETRNTYGILVGKHKGKMPFGCPLNRYGDNIKMDLKEMDRVNLAEGRCKWRALSNATMDFRSFIDCLRKH